MSEREEQAWTKAFMDFDASWSRVNGRRRASPDGVRETYFGAGYAARNQQIAAERVARQAAEADRDHQVRVAVEMEESAAAALDQLIARDQQIATLREGLKFYASVSTYQRPLTEYGWGKDVPIEQDKGRRARTLLATPAGEGGEGEAE